MIARSLGAHVVAIDPVAAARERAAALGAVAMPEAVGTDFTVSIDAIGGADSLLASVRCLARRGRHVQVGLMGAATSIPAEVISLTVARELELIGSHGMSAQDYPAMLNQVTRGILDPGSLVRHTVGLEEACGLLAGLATAEVDGVTVIRP
jgi:alcohol dehydrogenase